MRRHIGILLTTLTAGVGGLAAQQPLTGTHVGVGVSLNPAALLALDDGDLGLLLPTGFSAFTLPILPREPPPQPQQSAELHERSEGHDRAHLQPPGEGRADQVVGGEAPEDE